MNAFHSIPFLNNLNNYKNLEKICEGAYGKIYLCEESNSKQKYIIKKSKEKLTEEDESNFKNDIQKIRNLDHPAVLNFHGFIMYHQYPTFVTDYMPNKSLDQILKLKKKDISPLFTTTKRYIIFIGIAYAMKYLHDNQIIHGNLTPDNILLDEHFYPRISFFSFSKNYESSQKVLTIENPIFIPPETLDDDRYYAECDVYSFALISYQLITEIKPNIKAKDNYQRINRIKKGARPETSMIKDKKIINFLTNCWAPEAAKRYSFKRIVDDISKGEFESAFKGYDQDEVNRYIQLLKEKEKPPETTHQVATYTYYLDVAEGYNGERKPHEFTFPISFTVSDVIRQIEEEFDHKYRFSIIIKNKQGKRNVLEEDANLHDYYIGQETDEIYAAKLDIYYKFVTGDGKYKDDIKFKLNEKLNEISSYLEYDPAKDILKFTSESDYEYDFRYTDRLEFSYKGKKFSGQETFESLHFRRHDNDRIIIKIRKQIDTNDTIPTKKKQSIPYLFKEPESDYKCKITVNSGQTINNVIEKIKEKAQIDFDFEFASSKELTGDLLFFDYFDNKKFVIIKKIVNKKYNLEKNSQRPSRSAKGRLEEIGRNSQRPIRSAKLQPNVEAKGKPNVTSNEKQNETTKEKQNDPVKMDITQDNQDESKQKTTIESDKLKKVESEKVEKDELEILEKDRSKRGIKEEITKEKKEESEKIKKDESEKIKKDESEKIKKDESEKIKKDESEKIKKDESEKIKKDESEKIKKEESDKVKKEESEKIKKDESEKIKKDESEKIKKEESDKVKKEESDKVKKEESEKIKKEESEKIKKEESDKLRKEESNKVKNDEITKEKKEESEKVEKNEITIEKKDESDKGKQDETTKRSQGETATTDSAIEKPDGLNKDATQATARIENCIYNFKVSEGYGGDREQCEFSIPRTATVSDAIRHIEDAFENKYSVKMLKQTSKGKAVKISSNSDNLYDSYHNEAGKIIVVKFDIEYKFITEDGKYKYESKFMREDKLSQISTHLKYYPTKNMLKFTREWSQFEYPERLVFEYKGRSFSSQETFEALQYNQHDEERIIIKIVKEETPNNPSLSDEQKVPVKNSISNSNSIQFYESLFELQKGKKVGFKFSLKSEKIEDYFLFVDDEFITFEEIRSLVAGHIVKKTQKDFNPKKLFFYYNGNELRSHFFKEIKYQEGQFLTVFIETRSFTVEIDDKTKTFDLEESCITVADLQRKISTKKMYLLKHKNKELKGEQNLNDLNIGSQDIITATLVKSKVLLFNGRIFDMNELHYYTQQDILQCFRSQLEIDTENSTFIYDNKKIDIYDFSNLPSISKVEVIPSRTRVKFNNFADSKYNNLFFRDQEIGDVRKYIYDRMITTNAVVIKAQNKLLLNNTKLYQVDGQIQIEELTEKYYSKKIVISRKLNQVVTNYFPPNAIGSDLRRIAKKYIYFQFSLFYDDEEIHDNDRICEFGEEIEVKIEKTKIDKDDNLNEKVTFIINNKERVDSFSDKKRLLDYKKSLQLNENNQYVFFSHGKVFLDDKDTFHLLKKFDEKERIVHVYQINNINIDLFNQTARSTQRSTKEYKKIDTITICNLNEDVNTKVSFENDSSLISVFDLTQKVGSLLNAECVSLFIKFAINGMEDFVLLSDEEEIVKVINESATKMIYYKVLKGRATTLRPKVVDRYKNYAKKAGVNLTNAQINEMNSRVDSDQNLLLNTLDYIIYRSANI